ncbi:MAG: hypothetical protein KGN84_14015 [Acidobacteriota bacterium]|nr:hypothetical protein [Acidobacteriota bacterium]
MDSCFDYSKWSEAELARAESTAEEFLSRNREQIVKIFQRQQVALQQLLRILERPDLSLQERLDCLARISEMADCLKECANGFFELGAQPLVARVVQYPQD